jgi:hypothetical protein
LDERRFRRDEEPPLPRRRGSEPPVHPGRQLLKLFRDFEQHCKAATTAQAAIRRHLQIHEELVPLWEDFQMRGGSTADDLVQWLVDDDWQRKDMLMRKGHLRLISSREPAVGKKRERVRLSRRRRYGDDDDPLDAA